jgi:hypothetical protein
VIEKVLLLVTQLDFHLTQLKERVEEMANNIKDVLKRLEMPRNDLKNDVDKTKGPAQKCRQERGILKTVKAEKDNNY